MFQHAHENSASDIALCFNLRSSSLRFALFRVDDDGEHKLATGAVEQLGTPLAHARLTVGGYHIERTCSNADSARALLTALDLLGEQRLPSPAVVGHSVVHGGQAHTCPTRIDETLMSSLRGLVPLAPLQLPAAIRALEAALARLPEVPQVACFETAFHAHLPEYAARYPLPGKLFEQGLRRYGSHGLSYEYVMSTLGVFPPNRVIIAHLGNGASLVAVREGRSVDTTMGLSPNGGIPMGSRVGDLDPGVLIYLQREAGYSLSALEQLLNHGAGLYGIAGSQDFQHLSNTQAEDPSARLATLTFGYAVRKAIGAYFAALGGLDLLVFTGGIGEHSAQLRSESCRGLDALGITLNDEKNARNDREVHAGACPILVLGNDENRTIARHARSLLRARSRENAAVTAEVRAS